MKYSTIEDVMAIFPHPILPTVDGEPDYQTIHATRKFLQANSRAIGTHLGGGTLVHLGLIISYASYAIDKLLPLPQPPVRARTDAWTNPSAQRATQLRSVLARVYAVSIQNQTTTTVP
jgi:hypothetical protein